MQPIISVIVPVYNVEKYLKRCMDSIFAQTFNDYEVILVDDGSTDKSGMMCDDYAENNTNIFVIHKENKGPSHTRNIGIENAKGQFVYFLDSDDYIIPECLEILYKNINTTHSDVSCGSFGFFDEHIPVKLVKDSNVIRSDTGKSACTKLLYGKVYYTSSCNILIKKEIAEKNLFPVGKFHEDEMTTFRYFLDSSKVVITKKQTYYYFQREGSIMHSFGQPVIDELLSADYYIDYCKELDKDLYKASLCKKYYLYSETIRNYPQLLEFYPDLYSQVFSYLKSNMFQILMNFNIPIRTKISYFQKIICHLGDV